jgi:hypothetical protein
MVNLEISKHLRWDGHVGPTCIQCHLCCLAQTQLDAGRWWSRLVVRGFNNGASNNINLLGEGSHGIKQRVEGKFKPFRVAAASSGCPPRC